MARSADNPWLHRFAILTALVTLALIGIGGLVTSHEAGMSVPDWPTTYGYNMFLFPIRLWRGGIFYEHTHRLLASAVGLLTAILAIWLWVKESRSWLRWLGVIAFFGVVLQGVLGGLRVVLFKDQIGIFHAALAQAFFVLLCAIALFTGPGGEICRPDAALLPDHAGLRRLLLCVHAAHFRATDSRRDHATPARRAGHSGLSARLPQALARHGCRVRRLLQSSSRLEVQEPNPITAFQIILQMVHRLVAVLILCAVAFCAWSTPPPARRAPSAGRRVRWSGWA